MVETRYSPHACVCYPHIKIYCIEPAVNYSPLVLAWICCPLPAKKQSLAIPVMDRWWISRRKKYTTFTGWWYTYPFETYEFVSWDDKNPNICKTKLHVPNHQPV